MTPDCERAKAKATETIEKYGSMCPLSILKKMPGVRVVSYAETSEYVGIDRQKLLTMFGEHNQDAFSTAFIEGGKKRYLVIYNKQLNCASTRKALARELGHIVLGHDGTRPEAARNEEAVCFANHLLGELEK